MFYISSLMSSTGVIHGGPAQYLDYQDFMFIACVVVLTLAIEFLLPSYVLLARPHDKIIIPVGFFIFFLQLVDVE